MENLFFYINFFNQNLENNYFLFILLYLISLIIFFTFSLPGSPLLSIASGFFFGLYAGFLINIISILIGSYFFVYFAKIIFKNFLNKLHSKFSNKITNLIKHSSYEYLIIFRLIQGNPLFIQNLCLSFVNISKKKFIISSCIGLSPAIFAFSYFGSKLSQIYEINYIKFSDIISKDFILFLAIVILFLIFRIIYNFKIKKK